MSHDDPSDPKPSATANLSALTLTAKLRMLENVPFSITQGVRQVDNLLESNSWDDPDVRALLLMEPGSDEAQPFMETLMEQMEWITYVPLYYVGGDISVAAIRPAREKLQYVSYGLIDPVSGRLQVVSVQELIELYRYPVGELQTSLWTLIPAVSTAVKKLVGA